MVSHLKTLRCNQRLQKEIKFLNELIVIQKDNLKHIDELITHHQFNILTGNSAFLRKESKEYLCNCYNSKSRIISDLYLMKADIISVKKDLLIF